MVARSDPLIHANLDTNTIRAGLLYWVFKKESRWPATYFQNMKLLKVLNGTKLIISLSGIIQNLQKSQLQQISSWSRTFLDTLYNKLALKSWSRCRGSLPSRSSRPLCIRTWHCNWNWRIIISFIIIWYY